MSVLACDVDVDFSSEFPLNFRLIFVFVCLFVREGEGGRARRASLCR